MFSAAQLLQQEIIDETDLFMDNDQTARVDPRLLTRSLPPRLRKLASGHFTPRVGRLVALRSAGSATAALGSGYHGPGSPAGFRESSSNGQGSSPPAGVSHVSHMGGFAGDGLRQTQGVMTHQHTSNKDRVHHQRHHGHHHNHPGNNHGGSFLNTRRVRFAGASSEILKAPLLDPDELPIRSPSPAAVDKHNSDS